MPTPALSTVWLDSGLNRIIPYIIYYIMYARCDEYIYIYNIYMREVSYMDSMAMVKLRLVKSSRWAH